MLTETDTEWRERRRSTRYPLALELRYMAVCEAVLRIGYGTTIDISGKSILFRADAELAPQTRVELSVGWPAMHAGEPLRLFLYGSILRSDGRGVAALIERYSLVPEIADRSRGAASEWDRILERYRGKLLKLGRGVAPRG
jgi:hypothetical protein